MTAKLILNPYSGRWNAARRKEAVQEALTAAGLDFEVAETRAPGHGIDLAAEAYRDGYRPIVVAGGDGAIGEVVNGMFQAQSEGVLGPFGVLPLGTANDLAHNLGLPQGLEEAARAVAAGTVRRIDLGKVNGWVFCNNSAVGLEPRVTIYNIRMVRLRGMIRYLVAALRAIAEKKEWAMDLEWDDGRYAGPVSLVSVGNGAITGGMFRMAPSADLADGLLTFVYGYAPTRRRMLALLPRAMSGEFVNDAAIHQIHTRRLNIQSDPPTPLQADGELRGEELSQVNYEVLPARLDILAPPLPSPAR